MPPRKFCTGCCASSGIACSRGSDSNATMLRRLSSPQTMLGSLPRAPKGLVHHLLAALELQPCAFTAREECVRRRGACHARDARDDVHIVGSELVPEALGQHDVVGLGGAVMRVVRRAHQASTGGHQHHAAAAPRQHRTRIAVHELTRTGHVDGDPSQLVIQPGVRLEERPHVGDARVVDQQPYLARTEDRVAPADREPQDRSPRAAPRRGGLARAPCRSPATVAGSRPARSGSVRGVRRHARRRLVGEPQLGQTELAAVIGPHRADQAAIPCPCTFYLGACHCQARVAWSSIAATQCSSGARAARGLLPGAPAGKYDPADRAV